MIILPSLWFTGDHKAGLKWWNIAFDKNDYESSACRQY